MRQIITRDLSSRNFDTTAGTKKKEESPKVSTENGNNNKKVQDVRKKWESRASTGHVDLKAIKQFTSGAANTIGGATKTVAKGTIGATKTVAKGTYGATKTVAKGTIGATKTVAQGTIGATKTVAKSTIGITKKTGKSARQTIEDVALFASPRVVQKKLNVGKNHKGKSTKKIGIPSVFEKSEDEKTQPVKPSPKAAAPREGILSIKEKARAYEFQMQERAKKFDITPNAPGTSPFRMHGKRTSTLHGFKPLANLDYDEDDDPKTTLKEEMEDKTIPEEPKPQEEEREIKKPVVEEETLSPTSAGSLASEEDAAAAAPEETTTEVVEEVEEQPKKKKNDKGEKSRIDRDTVILQEMDEIIRIAEETEIYDEIDDETIAILKESALKSKAYTKRWYDVYTDSFIHCPSLAQTIVDYTLLEIAEDKFQELYDEEFPMLYTVGLRGVACTWVGEEEEVADYVYDLAEES